MNIRLKWVNLKFLFTELTCTCDALLDLVTFVQFKNQEKQPWRSVTFNKVFTKSITSPWAFFTFLKLYRWYQIPKSLSFACLGCRLIHGLKGQNQNQNVPCSNLTVLSVRLSNKPPWQGSR